MRKGGRKRGDKGVLRAESSLEKSNLFKRKETELRMPSERVLCWKTTTLGSVSPGSETRHTEASVAVVERGAGYISCKQQNLATLFTWYWFLRHANTRGMGP